MPSVLKIKRLVWALTFALTSAVALLSYTSGTRYVAAMDAVEHTLAVGAAINQTLSLLKDAETGQRGFLLSGMPRFLEPYESAGRELEPALARLEQAVQGDPAQVARLPRLRELIDEKRRFMAGTIELRRAGAVEQVAERVRGGRGKMAMDAIRAECQAMLGHSAGSKCVGPCGAIATAFRVTCTLPAAT